MQKFVLVTGGSAQQRNRYIATQQSKTTREVRGLMALSNEEILYQMEHSWRVDLYLEMDKPRNLTPEILDKVTERVHLSEEGDDVFVTETDHNGKSIQYPYDNDADLSYWPAIIETKVVIIGNSDDYRTIFPSSMLNGEDCHAAFAFGILLCNRELHDPFVYDAAEMAYRMKKLFRSIIEIAYDPKTRTGFATINESSPPEVGMTRCLPEDI